MTEAAYQIPETSLSQTGEDTHSAVVRIQSTEDNVFGSFFLGLSEFAIPASHVKDVINAPEKLMQQPLAPEYLIGILTLRGMVMPVIDLSEMFRIDSTPASSKQKKIAIIEYRNYHVGLLFDETGEVFRNQSGQLKYSEYERRGPHAVTRGAFEFNSGQRIVQLLDTKAVIELEGNHLTRVVDEQPAETDHRRIARGKRLQSISFRVGPCELAIGIDDIQEIIQIEQLENSALADGICIGTTNLRGQTVPLVDLALLLDYQPDELSQSAPKAHQILVSHVHGMPVGLVVSEISDILHYFADEIVNFPVISVRKPELFAGCLKASDGRQVLQLEIDALLTSDELEVVTKGYSGLFGRQEISEAESNARLDYETQTFLTFEIDRLYALSILDIVEVLDYPDQLLRPPHQSGYFDGLINLRGELIGVINAWSLYGIDAENTRGHHIIVFEHDEARFGLAIDSICAIVHLQQKQRQKLPSAMVNTQSAICADAKEAIAYNETAESGLQDMLILDIEAIGRRIGAGAL